MEDVTYIKINEHERDHWWYRVRRNITRNLITRFKPDYRPTILDVGCGTGMLLTELSDIGEITGIDISQLAVDFCKARGLSNVAVSDGTTIPYSNESFDMVLALDVIEHIQDDAVAAQEILRVLKPGGTAIVFVPAFRFLWGHNDELGQHVRRYTKSELIALFEHTGYSIERASYFNFFLFIPILLVRQFNRMFGSQTASELESNGRMMNRVLYRIFNLEYLLLRVTNFPFGVSAMVVARKRT
jgi:SAM-dependent methyltransferase